MELRLQLPPTEHHLYRAGQYVDILLRDGRRRAFSLANCPADDEHLVLHIRHVPGGAFSGQVFEALGVRVLLRLQGPLGNFHLRADSDRTAVFLAGGTERVAPSGRRPRYNPRSDPFSELTTREMTG